MQFKKWIQIHESPYATVNPPIKDELGDIEIIDLRAEDWEIYPNSIKTELARELRKSVILYGRAYPSFFGQLPDGRYLYHLSNDDFNYVVVNSRPSDDEAIDLDDLPLKSNWWDYVQGIDRDNKVIKNPSRLRDAEIIKV